MKAQKNTRKSATVNQIMGFQEWGLITILSIPWGGFFFFVGVAVKEMSTHDCIMQGTSANPTASSSKDSARLFNFSERKCLSIILH